MAYLDLASHFVGPQTVIVIGHRLAGASPQTALAPQTQRQLYEATLLLHGVGVSLIDTTTHTEVLHACLSGVRVWSTQWAPHASINSASIREVLLNSLGFDTHDSLRGYRYSRFTIDSLQVSRYCFGALTSSFRWTHN